MEKINEYEIRKFRDDDIELEIFISSIEETTWMSLDQIAALYNRHKYF